MRKFLLIIIGLVITVLGYSREFVVTDFGVKNDSSMLCTRAIQNVIDSASQNGGGTVVIPRGVFLSGALFFKPHTRLKLLEGAILKGSDDIAHYPLLPSRMEGKILDYYAALINAYSVDSFSITGPGTINGNGLKFWKQFWAYRDSLKKLGQYATNLDVHRPRLIFIQNCNYVTVQNVKLCNSGYWTTHLYKCNHILIENAEIRSPSKPIPAPSTDGIDLDVCSNVVIRNCYISVNDDAVCIKGGKGPLAHKLSENGVVENVLIENCRAAFPSPSILTLGSECVHAQNIKVRNCSVENCSEILLLKMRPDTYQVYEDISVENVTGTCKNVIKMNPWKQFANLEGTTEKPFGIVRNITISNIKADCMQLGIMEGNPEDQVSDIVFSNINISAKTPGIKTHFNNLKFENVVINGVLFDKN
jgi:polygalacturonase